MKPLSKLFDEIDSLFQRQSEAAYGDFATSIGNKPCEPPASFDLEDDFLFGGQAEVKTNQSIMSWTKPTGKGSRPSTSGVTYDPTHSNWIGRDVIPGMKFEQHSPGVISAKLS